MSSANPRVRTPSQPGKYVGEYNKMDWILHPWGGEIHDIVSSLKKRVRNSKFCNNLRWQSSRQSHGDLSLCPFHKYREGELLVLKRPEMGMSRMVTMATRNCNFYHYIPLLFVGHPSHPLFKLVIFHNKSQKNKQEKVTNI